jgi:hypothetical protein
MKERKTNDGYHNRENAFRKLLKCTRRLHTYIDPTRSVLGQTSDAGHSARFEKQISMRITNLVLQGRVYLQPSLNDVAMV